MPTIKNPTPPPKDKPILNDITLTVKHRRNPHHHESQRLWQEHAGECAGRTPRRHAAAMSELPGENC